jgi:hypothetical protein
MAWVDFTALVLGVSTLATLLHWISNDDPPPARYVPIPAQLSALCYLLLHALGKGPTHTRAWIYSILVVAAWAGRTALVSGRAIAPSPPGCAAVNGSVQGFLLTVAGVLAFGDLSTATTWEFVTLGIGWFCLVVSTVVFAQLDPAACTHDPPVRPPDPPAYVEPVYPDLDRTLDAPPAYVRRPSPPPAVLTMGTV